MFTSDVVKASGTDIARVLELPLSKLYPTLHNLTAEGYLRKDENKKYSLGLRILEKANFVLQSIDVRRIAKPYLRALSQKYKSNSHLSVLYGYNVMHVELQHILPSVIHGESVGTAVPAYCTAVGKALLAFQGASAIDAYVEMEHLKRRTDHTIVEPVSFRRELEGVRRDGYALDRGEYHEQIRCVAAPVRGYDGEVVAAVGISVHREVRNRDLKAMITPDVVEAALRISMALGLAGPQGGEE